MHIFFLNPCYFNMASHMLKKLKDISFQCMTKFTTKKEKKKNLKKKKSVSIGSKVLYYSAYRVKCIK